MSKNYQMYIGGKWVDAENRETFEDHNPYNGEVFANVPKGKREDATRAIEAAAAAFPEWAATPPSLRRKLFLKAADIFEKRQDELVRVVSRGDRLDHRHRHVPNVLRARLVPGSRGAGI